MMIPCRLEISTGREPLFHEPHHRLKLFGRDRDAPPGPHETPLVSQLDAHREVAGSHEDAITRLGVIPTCREALQE